MACTSNTSGCVDQYNCAGGSCPDFKIRRNDTKPELKVKIQDCDGPLDLTDLVLEASMWANGRLKSAMSDSIDYLSLADNIGFNQIMIDDVIIVSGPRQTEHMLVVAFDEKNRYVNVHRGYHGTTPQAWSKGQQVKIIKFMNSQANTEMVLQDTLNLDGTTTKDVLVDSYFVYPWKGSDTCLPGCYFLEFKLMKMVVPVRVDAASETPSFSDPSLIDYHCGLPGGIEWIRRFPVDSEGYTIKIYDSPTSEI